MPQYCIAGAHSRGTVNVSRTLFRLSAFIWTLVLTCLLSACGDDDPALQPPAGLGYGMTSAVYQVGTPIVANHPTASGGTITGFTVSPALPAGLSFSASTGVISGTPTAVSPSTVYTVTAQNAAGSATGRVQIEVRSVAAAPATLTYRDTTVTYTAGQAIAMNTPTNSGGPITTYSIAPALPAGLSLDPLTGFISGTPTTTTPSTTYTVTGTNVSGSITVTLQITVSAAVIAPATLSYTTASALYVANEPITPNAPVATGGAITSFVVSPALPAGLSLNSATGVVSGTPAAIQASITYTITGANTAGSVQAQVKIGVTSRGNWSLVAPMPFPVHYFTATLLNDGRVLVAGGFGAGGVTSAAWIYDPAGNTWTLTAPMNSNRSGHTATLLPNGRVLVAGGQNVSFGDTNTAEIYDPAAGLWSMVGSMSEARENHTATLLPSGKVLVAGGYQNSGSITFSASMDLYDPATSIWTRMSSTLASPRAQHVASLLPDGNVLLLGGIYGSGFVNTIEHVAIDDRGTTTVASPVSGNVTVGTTLLDGTILAMTDASANAYRYDPTTSTWTTSTMAIRRSIPTVTLLPDGRVLVAGGTNFAGGGVREASAEIYNPDTNTWTAAASMTAGRNGAQAVVLTDGSVLMIGGFNGSEVSVVERFQP